MWLFLGCTGSDITTFNREWEIWFIWQHIQYVITVHPKPCTETNFWILHICYQYCVTVSCNFCHQFLNLASLNKSNSQLYVFCDKKFIDLSATTQYGFDGPGYVLPYIIIIIIIFLHGMGHLTCSSIDTLPSFPGASTVSSSSRFVVEGTFWESGVCHSFKVVDPVLFVFESHVLYSRDL